MSYLLSDLYFSSSRNGTVLFDEFFEPQTIRVYGSRLSLGKSSIRPSMALLRKRDLLLLVGLPQINDIVLEKCWRRSALSFVERKIVSFDHRTGGLPACVVLDLDCFEHRRKVAAQFGKPRARLLVLNDDVVTKFSNAAFPIFGILDCTVLGIFDDGPKSLFPCPIGLNAALRRRSFMKAASASSGVAYSGSLLAGTNACAWTLFPNVS